jgi:hypothetical protein
MLSVPLILRLTNSLLDWLEELNAGSAASAAATAGSSSSSSSSSGGEGVSWEVALTVNAANTVGLLILALKPILEASVFDMAAATLWLPELQQQGEGAAAAAAAVKGRFCCLPSVLEHLTPMLKCMERLMRQAGQPAVAGRPVLARVLKRAALQLLLLCGSTEGKLSNLPCLPVLASAYPTGSTQQQQLQSLIVSLLKASRVEATITGEACYRSSVAVAFLLTATGHSRTPGTADSNRIINAAGGSSSGGGDGGSSDGGCSGGNSGGLNSSWKRIGDVVLATGVSPDAGPPAETLLPVFALLGRCCTHLAVQLLSELPAVLQRASQLGHAAGVQQQLQHLGPGSPLPGLAAWCNNVCFVASIITPWSGGAPVPMLDACCHAWLRLQTPGAQAGQQLEAAGYDVNGVTQQLQGAASSTGCT